jgi:hypothetical protein
MCALRFELRGQQVTTIFRWKHGRVSRDYFRILPKKVPKKAIVSAAGGIPFVGARGPLLHVEFPAEPALQRLLVGIGISFVERVAGVAHRVEGFGSFFEPGREPQREHYPLGALRIQQVPRARLAPAVSGIEHVGKA